MRAAPTPRLALGAGARRLFAALLAAAALAPSAGLAADGPA